MKKLIILSLLIIPFSLKPQSLAEYNKNGDVAKERKDYREAMFWYDQGVSNCDRYSMNQLRDIWMADSSIHVSMRVVMGKCLDCLNEQALAKDSLAIKQIIEYYSEGIGTVQNEVSANYWKEQLEQLRRPVTNLYIPQRPKASMKFFVGYHTSPIAPFGIQVGGMGKSVGWYVRFRSNLSFQATKLDGEIKQKQLIIEELGKDIFYRGTDKYKETVLTGSAGIMVKAFPNCFVSAGVGYWDRKYAAEFVRVNDNGTVQSSSEWARVTNSSMNGVTIDLDGTYVISERFYVSMGASLMSFNYVYPNIGVGIVF